MFLVNVQSYNKSCNFYKFIFLHTTLTSIENDAFKLTQHPEVSNARYPEMFIGLIICFN